MRIIRPINHVGMFLAVVMAVGALAMTAGVTAQPPQLKPGPEHDWLKEAEGTWDLTFKGQEGKGTSTSKMGIGGLWLTDHVKAEFAGMPFEGGGATTYDPMSKKFVNVWIDSMATHPMVSEGTYDKEKKTLTLVGDMALPDGKTVKATQVIVYKDEDNKTFTLSWPGPDGQVAEAMTIFYKRRPKD